MFIIVRFGADEEELFNPDCAMRIFVEDVKKRCNCVEKDSIGFMDEKGVLVNIPDDKSMDSAARHFTHRAVYTLLSLDKKGDITCYIPLIDDPSKELLGKLESYSSGTAKNLKTSMRRGSKTPLSINKPGSQLSGKGRRK